MATLFIYAPLRCYFSHRIRDNHRPLPVPLIIQTALMMINAHTSPFPIRKHNIDGVV